MMLRLVAIIINEVNEIFKSAIYSKTLKNRIIRFRCTEARKNKDKQRCFLPGVGNPSNINCKQPFKPSKFQNNKCQFKGM